jgi:hypothetical protein
MSTCLSLNQTRLEEEEKKLDDLFDSWTNLKCISKGKIL